MLNNMSCGFGEFVFYAFGVSAALGSEGECNHSYSLGSPSMGILKFAHIW